MTSDSEDNVKDFNSWLDNFSNEIDIETEPYELKTETVQETNSETNNEEIEIILSEPANENAPEYIPLNFDEDIGEHEPDYDPAAWAEIAYEIQAFVKHPDDNDQKISQTKASSKLAIDDLLDRFIKKNPSISRTKTEFYKPENMARKSEEFHGEVASETLANLFYKQGHLHKSLEIYEKLMLQNPDKKDNFAARIFSIKEELINQL